MWSQTLWIWLGVLNPWWCQQKPWIKGLAPRCDEWMNFQRLKGTIHSNIPVTIKTLEQGWLNQYLVKLTISPETCPVWKKGFRPISPTNKTKMHIEVQHVCNMKIVEYIYIYYRPEFSVSKKSPTNPWPVFGWWFRSRFANCPKECSNYKVPKCLHPGKTGTWTWAYNPLWAFSL